MAQQNRAKSLSFQCLPLLLVKALSTRFVPQSAALGHGSLEPLPGCPKDELVCVGETLEQRRCWSSMEGGWLQVPRSAREFHCNEQRLAETLHLISGYDLAWRRIA